MNLHVGGHCGLSSLAWVQRSNLDSKDTVENGPRFLSRQRDTPEFCSPEAFCLILVYLPNFSTTPSHLLPQAFLCTVRKEEDPVAPFLFLQPVTMASHWDGAPGACFSCRT